MANALKEEGLQVGRDKVRRLMKDAGVVVKRRNTRKPQTTDSRHGYGVAPNVLDRGIDVAEPHIAWAGDITSIWTREGWLYLAVLLWTCTPGKLWGGRLEVGWMWGWLKGL